MTHYLVIGAVRIQQWITRTPHLALTRGASLALTRRTSIGHLSNKPELWTSVQPLHLDEEAADIDGVVVLNSDREITDEQVDAVMSMLADELPGVEWRGWTQEASSYVEAYRMSGGGQNSSRVFHRPPAIRRLPMLAECDGCHEESALEVVTLKRGDANEMQSYGPDCTMRRAHYAGWRPQAREATEFEHLTKTEPKPLPGQQDRRLVAMGRRDADNHLALIAADGNRMGDFFKAVAATGDTSVHRKLSMALDGATKQATEDARSQTCEWMVPNHTYYPDIVHYVGGDDVLATVAARFAWIWAVELTKSFTETFGRNVAEAVRDLPPNQSGPILAAAAGASLGVGMAFRHYKAPFAAGREMANAAETLAKQAGAGKRAAIAWADTTVHDAILPHQCITAAEADQQLRSTHVLGDLSSSARASLGELLRTTPGDEQAEVVRDWAERTRHAAVIKRLELETDPEEGCPQLSADLDRTRWWPLRPQEES